MSDFDQLDKWIDKNAPGLNKEVLHTFIGEVGESESNSNYKEEVSGTATNPFTNAEKEIDEIISMLRNLEATAFIEFDFSGMDGEKVVACVTATNTDDGTLINAMYTRIENNASVSIQVQYTFIEGDFAISSLLLAEGRNIDNITEVAQYIPTKTTIIYHPLEGHIE